MQELGAAHVARSISQVLYCQKMWLWSDLHVIAYSEKFFQLLKQEKICFALCYVYA